MPINATEPSVSFTEKVDTRPVGNSTQLGVARLYVGIKANTGPVGLTPIDSPTEFLTTYTTNSLVEKSDHITLKTAYLLSMTYPLLVNRIVNTELLGAVTSDGKSLLVDSNVNYSNEYFTSLEVLDSIPENAYALIGDYVIFYGVNPEIPDTISVELYNSYKTSNELYSDIATAIKESTPYYAQITTEERKPINKLELYSESSLVTVPNKPKEGYSGTCLINSSEFESGYKVDLSDSAFILYSLYPSSSNTHYFSISDVEDNQFVLDIDGEVGTYSLSDKVDKYGTNISLENYTPSSNVGIRILNENTEISPVVKQEFGNSGYAGDIITVNDFSKALSKLTEDDVYRTELIAAGGLVDTNYYKEIHNICSQIFAMAILSAPNYSKKADIKRFADGLGINDVHGYAYLVGGWLRDTSHFTFNMDVPPEVAYMQCVNSNKGQNGEFLGIFSENNSLVTGFNLLSNLNEKDRVDLLSSRCNYIRKKIISGTSYTFFNQNYTLNLNMNSPLKVENNRRLINRIYHDWKDLLRQFIGRINNVDTRLDVIDLLTNYINSEIQSQLYGLSDFVIKCDEENNPPSIVQAEKLVVNGGFLCNQSIKFVDVPTIVTNLSLDQINFTNTYARSD